MRLLPFSKQMDVSCLLPITFKMWLVLLEGVLNERDAARCFQGWGSVRGFLQQKGRHIFSMFFLTYTSQSQLVPALWLSWAFSYAFSCITSVCAESVNCRNTFGMCVEDSRDGCVTDPWPSLWAGGVFCKALGSAVM